MGAAGEKVGTAPHRRLERLQDLDGLIAGRTARTAHASGPRRCRALARQVVMAPRNSRPTTLRHLVRGITNAASLEFRVYRFVQVAGTPTHARP